MAKKIAVVTGATSKIMETVINELVAFDFQIIAVSRKSQQKPKDNNIQWVVCDLSLPNSDFSFLKNVDILFHAAAVSNDYRKEEYLINNYGSTIHLVDAALNFKVKKMVYISSILAGYEYGDYGLSKIKSEEYIIQNVKDWLILRPSQVYGYRGKNPIDQMIEKVRKYRFIVCPTGDRQEIYPIYYEDLAEKIIDYSIVKDEFKKIKNIIGPESFSYKGLSKEIARNLNKTIFIIPAPKFIVLAVYLIISRLKLRIGIYPDKLYRFYHSHGSTNAPLNNLRSIADYLSGKN
jgi:nucleoside-diphosphate-sugar epimerase